VTKKWKHAVKWHLPCWYVLKSYFLDNFWQAITIFKYVWLHVCSTQQWPSRTIQLSGICKLSLNICVNIKRSKYVKQPCGPISLNSLLQIGHNSNSVPHWLQIYFSNPISKYSLSSSNTWSFMTTQLWESWKPLVSMYFIPGKNEQNTITLSLQRYHQQPYNCHKTEFYYRVDASYSRARPLCQLDNLWSYKEQTFFSCFFPIGFFWVFFSPKGKCMFF